jgi:anaerobic dimethyl sulfoxide reductase subunit B (iron-sulfur subunit)
MKIDEGDGTVQRDKELCIGCMACKDGCPYSVPQYLEVEGISGKCDMCKDLIERGERPVCVDACLMRALEWGELDDIRTRDANAVQDISILPDSSNTNPSTYIIPRPSALEKDFTLKAI